MSQVYQPQMPRDYIGPALQIAQQRPDYWAEIQKAQQAEMQRKIQLQQYAMLQQKAQLNQALYNRFLNGGSAVAAAVPAGNPYVGNASGAAPVEDYLNVGRPTANLGGGTETTTVTEDETYTPSEFDAAEVAPDGTAANGMLFSPFA